MKYELNNIYNEDSYKAIKDIPDNSIDLIIIDPPYKIESTIGGTNSKLAKSIENMNKSIEARRDTLANGIDGRIFPELIRVQPNINIYIWCNHKQIIQYLDYFVVQNGCKFNILFWWKPNAAPLFSNKYLTDKEYLLYLRKGGYCNPQSYEDAKTVFKHPLNVRDKKLFKHPTIKPLAAIKKIIRNSSKPGQVVADFFLGSGTTAVACKELDRKYIGFEIDKEYYKIAKDRLNGITSNGQTSMFTDFEELNK